jgi:hypothetical protein
MAENAAAADISLSPNTMAQVEDLVNQRTVAGPRYPPTMQATVDTEDWAA